MPQDKYIKYVPAEATMKRIGKWHVRLYRATRGLIGRRVDGLDILLLTTVGKKTGLARTVPLPYYRDGADYLLIASFGGNDKNPAWFLNLSANPRVEIQVGGKRLQVQAEVAAEPERQRLWANLVREYPRYVQYQAKTERKIPIVVLKTAN
ncbi:MAG: nitroreductase family deazaflavin-dependent oxidoreductase [Myxococcales bacterium]